MNGSLCASSILLVDVQVFLLYRESPDELAASVLSTLRCYEFGICEPTSKILIGIKLIRGLQVSKMFPCDELGLF